LARKEASSIYELTENGVIGVAIGLADAHAGNAGWTAAGISVVGIMSIGLPFKSVND
jgi:hypothetical protein